MLSGELQELFDRNPTRDKKELFQEFITKESQEKVHEHSLSELIEIYIEVLLEE